MESRSTHVAQEARRRVSFNSTEEVGLESIVHSYGIGVDCHSRFFAICALARQADRITKYQDTCDADYHEIIDRHCSPSRDQLGWDSTEEALRAPQVERDV